MIFFRKDKTSLRSMVNIQTTATEGAYLLIFFNFFSARNVLAMLLQQTNAAFLR